MKDAVSSHLLFVFEVNTGEVGFWDSHSVTNDDTLPLCKVVYCHSHTGFFFINHAKCAAEHTTIHKYLHLQDMRLSQQCCWRFKSYGMLHQADWWTVTDVSKEHSAVIFRALLGLFYPKDESPVILQNVGNWHSKSSKTCIFHTCTSIIQSGNHHKPGCDTN